MKKMSIVRQLTALMISFAISLPAVVFGVSYAMYQSGATARRLAAEGNRQTDALFALIASVGKVQSLTQHVVREKDPDILEQLIGGIETAIKESRERIQQASAANTEVASAFQAITEAGEKSRRAVLMGDYAQASETLIEQGNPAYERLCAAIDTLQDGSRKKYELVSSQAEARRSRVQYGIWLFVIILTGALTYFGIGSMRRISEKLQHTVHRLRTVAEQAETAVRPLSSSSHTLARGASEQAASLEETSAATEQINAMALTNGENSRAAADLMAQAQPKFKAANHALDQMVCSIGELNTACEGVAKIIKVIDGIAFQTNILALNAAVEAARAGEAGAGFSVVADEVRSLAKRSAQAAHETTGLIEQSITKSREGRARVSEVSEIIHGLTGEASSAAAMVIQVNQASQEQARGISQIAAAISQMQRVTQEVATSAEQSSSAAAAAEAQATVLHEVVEGLMALVSGSVEPAQ